MKVANSLSAPITNHEQIQMPFREGGLNDMGYYSAVAY